MRSSVSLATQAAGVSTASAFAGGAAVAEDTCKLVASSGVCGVGASSENSDAVAAINGGSDISSGRAARAAERIDAALDLACATTSLRLRSALHFSRFWSRSVWR